MFCATGSASVQCPALSPAARGVTWEDWRKEGEMAQARLQSFWDSDSGKFCVYLCVYLRDRVGNFS